MSKRKRFQVYFGYHPSWTYKLCLFFQFIPTIDFNINFDDRCLIKWSLTIGIYDWMWQIRKFTNHPSGKNFRIDYIK